MGGCRGANRQGTSTSQHKTLRESFLAFDIPGKNQAAATAIDSANSLSGLTLDAVLNNERRSPVVVDHHSHNHSQRCSNINRTRTSTSTCIAVRTLLDIIRNEETLSHPNTQFVGRKTWKSFKDRLKLRRLTTGSNWASSAPVPRSDLKVPGVRMMMMNRNCLRNNSIRRVVSFSGVPAIESVPCDEVVMRDNVEESEVMLRGGGSGSMRLSAAALAAERAETRRRLSREFVSNEDVKEEILASAGEESGGEEDEDDGGDGDEPEVVALPGGQQPVMMSLMDLLEETDRQAGIQGLTYRLDDEDGEEEEEEEEEEVEEMKGGALGKGEYTCCVCKVRHKGSAFTPCGHTYCRLCSRELWVQRGNCPLCNGFILEILDIC